MSFFHCEKLTSVTFAEEGLKSIPNSCFEGCISLKSAVLPKTVTSIGYAAFYISNGSKEPFEVWMSASVTSLPSNLILNQCPFSTVIVYAPEGSNAAKWALNSQGNPYSYATVRYGGSGCNELFGGSHDYSPISDAVSMDAETGLHIHDVVYECKRCYSQKTEEQAKTALGCWRCEAKAAYGDSASIPQEKFEFLDRYKLGGNVYYRIRLVSDHNGVKAGHEALFLDEQLQAITDREAIAALFKTHMYTGSGVLPWEYTETESDYPSLERREELIDSILTNASRSASLASTFIQLDVVMEKLGATASAGLTLLWGNPEGALKSLKEAAVPDTDLLLTAMHITILNKLAESAPYDARHYADSLKTIVDTDGFIICEEAEKSLDAYANALALWQLCIDNSSGIINEIEACGTDVGVGVRNIMTMLKGAVGVTGNPYAKTGVLVTSTMFSAITQSDDIGEECANLIIKYIGDLSKIIADASGSSCLGAFVTAYKADALALSEFLYVDNAMEKYERTYNAFCLKSDTPLYDAHEALAN